MLPHAFDDSLYLSKTMENKRGENEVMTKWIVDAMYLFYYDVDTRQMKW